MEAPPAVARPTKGSKFRQAARLFILFSGFLLLCLDLIDIPASLLV